MTVPELTLELPAQPAARDLRTPVTFTAVAVVLAPIAYMAMFSIFQAYDDEGYFLITLKNYSSGHPLFTEALPIYGPFFYEVMGGLFRVLGLPLSLDTGRFVTVGVWLIASVLGGVLTQRMTRSVWLGIAGQLLTFRVLATLVNEPMQPAGLISLLLLSLMLAATARSSRPRESAAATGVIVGALLLVKVNVGVFVATAVIFAWAACLPDQWRRFALPAMALLIVALPMLLMSALLNRAWVLDLAIVTALSAAAVGVATISSRAESRPEPSGRWIALGATVTGVLCLGVAMVGGTLLDDWWNRSLLLASRFPQIFVWPVSINAGIVVWAALSLLAAIVFCGPYARSVTPRDAGLLRVSAGILMWISMIVLPAALLALPLAWVVAQVPRGRDGVPAGTYPRLLLPALAVVASLQIYPVAGTQVSVAAIGLLPLGAMSLNDGIRQLHQAGTASVDAAKPANGIVLGMLGVSVAVFLLFSLLTATEFATLAPLGLPGAQTVRLSDDKDAQLRSLVGAIKDRCGSFITYPGMNSFYFWTEQDPPAELSSEVWWLVLDSPQQQSLLDQLQSQPRLCVVKNQRMIDFWAQGRPVPSRPLVEWIGNDFLKAGSYGDYELLIRRS